MVRLKPDATDRFAADKPAGLTGIGRARLDNP